jgi:sugar lactone lactonase YvrE
MIFGPDGNLYVDGGQTPGILRYNGTTGAFMDTFVQGGTGGLIGGKAMAFDQEGRLYVVDWFNAVHRYDAQGNSLGDLLVNSVNPSLAHPYGMTFDAQGDLLISCQGSNMVVRYDRGVDVTLSTASSTPVSVNYTTEDGSALAGTNYYALSGTATFNPGQTSQMILLATQEDPQATGNVSFSVQLNNPTGGATIGAGTAAVNEIVNDTTRQFAIADTSAIEGDTSARYLGAFVEGVPDAGIQLLTFGPDGNLYTETGNAVTTYNGATGALIGQLVPQVQGQIENPHDMVFNAGYLYVASTTNQEVLQFNATTGAFVSVFISGVNAHNMAVGPDANGNANADLYLSTSNGVSRYDGTTGAYLGTYITNGSGGLSGAGAMTFDPSQTYLYVASTGSNQVLKYNARTGAYVGVAASAGVSNPTDVKFGPDGLLYVLSSANNRILRYTANGTYVDDYVPAGSGGMINPTRMAFGPNGDLYVVGNPLFDDPAASQIFRFGTENKALFTVTNTTPSTLPLTVNYATADGTGNGGAVAGTNYTATSGTLTFAPGWTTATIAVPILDSASQTAPLTFTLSLSNPEGATLSRNQATGAIAPSDQQAKFYVVNGATSSLGGNNTTYKYQPNGSEQAPYGLSVTTATPDVSPQGIASNASGTMQWVVDVNKNVYVYSSSGTLLGSWSAGGLSSSTNLTGIATNGTDIWLVDSYSDKVYKYTGAASRLSGSQNAASSFSLASGHNGDPNPQDIVTDGTSFWVVDGTNHKVFKYTLSGSLLGSWSIDPADTHPTGITINPNNVSDIWIVDNGTDKVYQYIGAASRTSGSQNAGATFALAAGNTNPQGIADPPTAEMLLTPTAVSSRSNSRGTTAASSTSVPSNGVPSNGSPMSAADQLFANLARILSDARNAYQSELSSVPAMWQNADALALQRLDALLSMEAGAKGMKKDALMRDLFFASLSAPNGM